MQAALADLGADLSISLIRSSVLRMQDSVTHGPPSIVLADLALTLAEQSISLYPCLAVAETLSAVWEVLVQLGTDSVDAALEALGSVGASVGASGSLPTSRAAPASILLAKTTSALRARVLQSVFSVLDGDAGSSSVAGPIRLVRERELLREQLRSLAGWNSLPGHSGHSRFSRHTGSFCPGEAYSLPLPALPTRHTLVFSPYNSSSDRHSVMSETTYSCDEVKTVSAYAHLNGTQGSAGIGTMQGAADGGHGRGHGHGHGHVADNRSGGSGSGSGTSGSTGSGGSSSWGQSLEQLFENLRNRSISELLTHC